MNNNNIITHASLKINELVLISQIASKKKGSNQEGKRYISISLPFNKRYFCEESQSWQETPLKFIQVCFWKSHHLDLLNKLLKGDTIYIKGELSVKTSIVEDVNHHNIIVNPLFLKACSLRKTKEREEEQLKRKNQFLHDKIKREAEEKKALKLKEEKESKESPEENKGQPFLFDEKYQTTE